MTTPTVQDFENGKVDLDDLSSVLESEQMEISTRGGKKRKTAFAIGESIRRLAVGFNLSPSGFDFETGGTLTDNSKTISDASDNDWIYTLEIPEGGYNVAAGTVPNSPNYKQVTFNEAQNVSLSTGQNLQSFVDSFTLKIFQSPTNGGLTEIQTRTVGAGEVYEVRKASDNSLATIYSDAAGANEIARNGTDNKSGSGGAVEFYIADGDYTVIVGVASTKLSVGDGRCVVSDINLGLYTVGRRLTVEDRGGAIFEVVNGGVSNSYDILNAGGGNTAKLISDITKTSSVLDLSVSLGRTSEVIINTDQDINSALTVSGSHHVRQQKGITLNVAKNIAAITIEDSSSGLFEGVRAVGSAGSSDPSASMLINTQKSGVVNVSNTTYRDLNLSNMTMGLNLTETDNQKVLTSTFRGMELSPVIAGGYGVLLQGAKKTIIDGNYFEAGNNSRHSVYASRIVSEPSGQGNCSDLLVVNNISDWTSSPEDLGGRVPYIARSLYRAIYSGIISNGGKGSMILAAENGNSRDVIVSNDIQVGANSVDERFIANIAIGQGGDGVARFILSNGITKVEKGVGAEPYRDVGILLNKCSAGIISNRIISTDSGSAISLNDCSGLIIDDIIDLTLSSNSRGVIAFAGSCSGIIVGNVSHSRPDSSGISGLFVGLENVTNLTCQFPRSTRVIINNGVSSKIDKWDVVESIDVNTDHILVNWKKHVTQDATDTAIVSVVSGAVASARKSTTTAKTCKIFMLDFDGALINPTAFSGTLEINLRS